MHDMALKDPKGREALCVANLRFCLFQSVRTAKKTNKSMKQSQKQIKHKTPWRRKTPQTLAGCICGTEPRDGGSTQTQTWLSGGKAAAAPPHRHSPLLLPNRQRGEQQHRVAGRHNSQRTDGISSSSLWRPVQLLLRTAGGRSAPPRGTTEAWRESCLPPV